MEDEFQDFMKRAQVLLKDKVEERYEKHLKKLRKWNDENAEHLKKKGQAYRATENGKQKCRERSKKR